ncbi:MAG: outer membrane beta-barrel protein [Paludibacter sp.]|nr:outer membrane beta-barrel protein [Paludibacter sp.]
MRIKFLLFISLLITSTLISTHAQTFKKVPKQYSLEIGPRNLFSHRNITLNNSLGFGGLFDYAWQLSGFDGKKNKSFISVPMGYTVLPGNDASTERISMLNYGWTVRHELSRNKKITPFVGYGLFLNDLKIKGTEGSVFGHQTEFDFGLNFNTRTRLKYFVKLQYSYTSYPQFNEPQRIKLHYADLRLGVRF